jgi:CheY-like chemotaxis protein
MHYGIRNPEMDYEIIKSVPLPEYRSILDSSLKELIAEKKSLDLKIELKKINFNVIHAVNGKQAVEFCRSGEKIDMILMDIKIPVMNGYTATAEILKFMPDVPVIAQTAYTGKEDRNKIFKSGFSDFLEKPITKQQLISVLKKYLK